MVVILLILSQSHTNNKGSSWYASVPKSMQMVRSCSLIWTTADGEDPLVHFLWNFFTINNHFPWIIFDRQYGCSKEGCNCPVLLSRFSSCQIIRHALVCGSKFNDYSTVSHHCASSLQAYLVEFHIGAQNHRYIPPYCNDTSMEGRGVSEGQDLGVDW